MIARPPAVEVLEISVGSADDLAKAVAGSGLGFALIDRSRDEGVIDWIQACFPERLSSLLPGKRNSDLKRIAPYLLRLPPIGPLTDLVALRATSGAEFVFLEARAPFAEVVRHLRRQLVVEGEDGNSKLFRFYDPRVLRTYLPSLTEREASVFFGPIVGFDVVTGTPRSFLRYSRPGPPAAPRGRSWPLPIVRQEQDALFSHHLIEAFMDRMVERYRGVVAVSGKRPRERISNEIARAAGFGVVSAESIERWLALVATLGPAFDESHPWIRNELRAEGTEERRLLRIETRLRRDGLRRRPPAMS